MRELLTGMVITMPLMATLSLVAQLQTAVVPGDRFAWEMTGAGLPLIQSYRYEVEVDGHRLTDPLSDVKCAVGPPPIPFECTAPIPVSLGPHTLRVRSIDVSVFGMPAVEGAWSAPFSYVMAPARAVPAAPAKMRVVKP